MTFNFIKLPDLAGSIILGILFLVVIIMAGAFLDRMFISPPVDSKIDEQVERVSKQEVIQINVLNSTGIKGLAAKAKDYLKARGFDVVEIGNYDKKVGKSLVIDRIGDPGSAQKVAFAVGITENFVKSGIDSTLYLRTSIVIGSDYAELKPFN